MLPENFYQYFLCLLALVSLLLCVVSFPLKSCSSFFRLSRLSLISGLGMLEKDDCLLWRVFSLLVPFIRKKFGEQYLFCHKSSAFVLSSPAVLFMSNMYRCFHWLTGNIHNCQAVFSNGYSRIWRDKWNMINALCRVRLSRRKPRTISANVLPDINLILWKTYQLPSD